MNIFWQEVRWGLRGLARSSGFTAIAILTLALGIGANVTIFSLIDAVMLSTLPVRDSSQLVVFQWHAHNYPNTRRDIMSIECASDSARAEGCSFSYPMFDQFNSLTNTFADVAAMSGPTQLALNGNGPASVSRARFVSGKFFQTMGVMAALGRALESTDDKADAGSVAMLNYGYWQSEFGGSPSVIGKTIHLNGVAVTIVGVAAREFPGLDPGTVTDIWLPLTMRQQLIKDSYGSLGAAYDIWWLAVIARLNPGVSSVQAQSAAGDLFSSRVQYGPKVLLSAEDAPGIILLPAQEALAGMRKRFSKPLMTLMIAVMATLLIACTNVAGLMVARVTERETEIAMRLALGAGPVQIVRQIFTESVLISLAGGTLGVFLAFWSTPILTTFLSKGGLWSAHFDLHPGARVFAFTAAISVLAGILCGLAPAIRGTRVKLMTALKAGSRNLARGSRGPGQRFALGNLLVVAQVALATVMLVGAGLLVRTLANLKSIDSGFDTGQVLLFGIDPTLNGYKGARIQSLYRDLVNRLGALPGVVSASYSRETLLGGNLIGRDIYIEGVTQNSGVETSILPVGPNFFETMRIPLFAGRTFTPPDADSTAKPTAAIVNEAFARKYFQNENPLGRMFGGGQGAADWEIIGVVGDVKYKGLREETRPIVFLPLRDGRAYFELRATANPIALVPAVRSVVSELDDNLPLLDVKTVTEQIDRSLFIERLVALLSGLLGLLALAVACLGLYGLLTYEVARCTREIGIRMALGAKQSQVLRLMVGQGIRLTAIGVVIGIAVAFSMTRYLESLLYGVRPTDPLTFVCVAILLLMVAIAACYIPARRATGVDPVVALRYE